MKLNLALKKNGKWTPTGRAVRVFLYVGLGSFLALSGLDQSGNAGVVDIALLGKAAIGGLTAGITAVIAYVVNALEKDN